MTIVSSSSSISIFRGSLLRHSRLLLRGLLLTTPFAAMAYAQHPASFSTITTALTDPASISYSIDLNNDGTSDIASINNLNTNGGSILINLSKGDGTFGPTRSYALPNAGARLAFGDFLGNGKVDILVSVATISGAGFYVLLGNGDGTFGAPTLFTSTPPGAINATAIEPLLVADFNSDGVLDLVTSVSIPGSPAAFYLIESNSSGGYNPPRLIYSAPSTPSGETGYIAPAVLGDFNGDAHADIGFTYVTENTGGSNINSEVYVLYGDGAGNFNPIPIYNQPGQLYIQSGDLNSDGKTDIFGSPGDGRSLLLYGTGSETLTPFNIPGKLGGGTLGDFDGDGIMDLAYLNIGQNPTTATVAIAHGTASPGIFSTSGSYNSIPQDIYVSGGLLPGEYIHSNKPDLGLYQFNPGTALNDYAYTDATLSALLDTSSTGNWGACAYPSAGTGISVCAPVTSGSQTTFNSAANSYGMIRKIELWVDGVKIGEQYHTWGQRAWFGLTATVGPGTHQGTYYEADVDNRLQRSDFKFTVPASTKAVKTSK